MKQSSGGEIKKYWSVVFTDTEASDKWKIMVIIQDHLLLMCEQQNLFLNISTIMNLITTGHTRKQLFPNHYN